MTQNNEEVATFWEHLQELRNVLIHTFISIAAMMGLMLYFSQDIVTLVLDTLPKSLSLSLFSPQEGMLTLFKISFWLGLVAASPYWLFKFVQFIRPAIKKKTLTILPLFFSLSFIFIGVGVTFCYFATLPLANNYLFHFNQNLGHNLWGFSAYMDFAFLLFFSHAVAFECGAFLLLLVHMQILFWQILAQKRRHACILSLILGALLTPPDVLTQIMIAVPLYGFFELSIFYGKLRSKSIWRGRTLDHSCHVHLETDAIHPQAN